MSKRTIQIFALLVALVVVANAQECCNENKCNCENNCWEKCFVNPPNSKQYKDAYLDIYRTVMGIRNLYAPCFKPHGTAYMLDAAVPSITGISAGNLYLYQRHLAAIVSMVQPVGEQCNPMCVSKYYKNWAYYSHSWPCKSRCDAYNLFVNDIGIRSFQTDSSSSWVGGGEILAELCFDRPQLSGHKCMKCTKNELLISFSNSHNYWVPPSPLCGIKYYCASIGVNPASYSNMKSWANTGPAYHLPSTLYHRNAASRISRCISSQCCNKSFQNTWWTNGHLKGREEATVDSNANVEERRAKAVEEFEYMGKGDATPKTYKGTATDFENKVLKPAVASNGGGNDNHFTKPQPIRPMPILA